MRCRLTSTLTPRPKVVLLVATVCLALTCPTPAEAADVAAAIPGGNLQHHDGLVSSLYDEATFTGHLRTFLYDQTSTTQGDPAAWAIGGWIGYESGWIGEVLKFGAVGYTSQPLWAPANRSGSLLLSNDQQGFTVLGQAYAALKFSEQTATFYRQLVSQPEVNAHDNLMVPNSFEGITLQGGRGPLSYFGGVLSQMKTRNSGAFQNLGKAAGVRSTDLPMWLGGIKLSRDESAAARASFYVAPDLLASGYADGMWKTSLSRDVSLTLDGQFMYQGGVGDDLLTGCVCPTWVLGAQATLSIDHLSLLGGFTQTGNGADYQSPFGGWQGYTSMLVQNFNRAGEGALVAGISYDFAGAGIEGLVLSVSAAFDVRTQHDDAAWQEVDIGAVYNLKHLNPDWKILAPLLLRANYGYVDLGGDNTLNQFQLILDYEYRLHGDGREASSG